MWKQSIFSHNAQNLENNFWLTTTSLHKYLLYVNLPTSILYNYPSQVLKVRVTFFTVSILNELMNQCKYLIDPYFVSSDAIENRDSWESRDQPWSQSPGAENTETFDIVFWAKFGQNKKKKSDSCSKRKASNRFLIAFVFYCISRLHSGNARGGNWYRKKGKNLPLNCKFLIFVASLLMNLSSLGISRKSRFSQFREIGIPTSYYPH